MDGLDTNILLRYYVDDASDPAALRQRQVARQVMESGDVLAVCRTVILEFEWVLRGYYMLPRDDVIATLRHLLSLPQVQFDDRLIIERAVDNHAAGLDFADAMHHASYSHCARMLSFDDRGFARRSTRLNLQPNVRVPGRQPGAA